MFARLPFRTAAAGAALAAVGVMLAPSAASAQAYGYQDAPQYYGQSYDNGRYGSSDRYDDRYRDSNDYCRSDRNQRTGAGVAIGAGLGAVAGSQLAANGRRTEGSILGGVLGAFAGAAVGNDSARDCDRGYDQSRYGNDGYQSYDRYNDNAYSNGDNRYGYDDRYSSGDRYRYEDRSRYDYDRSGYQSGYSQSYGCRTVQTRTRDGNGRLVTRYEQSCPDRY